MGRRAGNGARDQQGPDSVETVGAWEDVVFSWGNCEGFYAGGCDQVCILRKFVRLWYGKQTGGAKNGSQENS